MAQEFRAGRLVDGCSAYSAIDSSACYKVKSHKAESFEDRLRRLTRTANSS